MYGSNEVLQDPFHCPQSGPIHSIKSLPKVNESYVRGVDMCMWATDILLAFNDLNYTVVKMHSKHAGFGLNMHSKDFP